MEYTRSSIVLWIGPKRSGKTTSAADLARFARRRGLRVAGVLQPAVYAQGELLGYDVVDLATDRRTALARRDGAGPTRTGRFAFRPEGLGLGRAALAQPAVRGADLVLVDEFGPLEVAGGGWRQAVETLTRSGESPVVVLVVRDDLVVEVRRMFSDRSLGVVPAAQPDAAARVTGIAGRKTGFSGPDGRPPSAPTGFEGT